MKHRMQVTATTTKPQMRTSISSAVRTGFGCGLSWGIDLLLQDGGYEVFRAHLRKQTLWLLALLSVEVVRVLTGVAVPVFAAGEQ
jgi:hypothetical protein